jgi:hypothetical protein
LKTLAAKFNILGAKLKTLAAKSNILRDVANILAADLKYSFTQ